MYENSYSTDWKQLDKEAAVERAFALGVAAACGEGNPSEYQRLRETAESAYKQSLIELSFTQGKSKGLQLITRGETADSVWESLILGETGGEPPAKRLPTALTQMEFLGPFEQLDGPPESLGKPRFLLRSGDDDW